jgi:hypothetical protein
MQDSKTPYNNMFLISSEMLQKQFDEIAKQAVDAALSSRISHNPVKVYRREDIAELFKTSVQWFRWLLKRKKYLNHKKKVMSYFGQMSR